VVAWYFRVRIGVRGGATHPTLSLLAQASEKPEPISFQFFAASPRPPSALKEEARKWVGFRVRLLVYYIIPL